MRLTLGEKYSYVAIGPPRSMAIILLLLAMMSAFSCAMVHGWQFDMEPSVQLSEGDSCRLRTGDSGICRRIETCTTVIEALNKKRIKYDSLVRCTFAGISEVICCPSDTDTQPTRTNPSPSWGTNTISPVRTTTTTTTSTTTTIRPLVIGDTVITGNEQFIDLSRVFGRTSSTTKRPWQNLEQSFGEDSGSTNTNSASNIQPDRSVNDGNNAVPNTGSNFRPDFGENNNPSFETNFGQNPAPNSRPDFGENNNQNFRMNFVQNSAPNSRPGLGENNNPNFGTNFVQNSGPNSRPGFGQNNNPNFVTNFGQNSGSNSRPGFGLNNNPNFGQNSRPNSRTGFGQNNDSNFGTNFGQNSGPNSRPGFGQNNNPNFVRNFGQNSGPNLRPGFAGNNNPNFGQNSRQNSRPGFGQNNNSNFGTNFGQHSGPNFRPGFGRNDNQNFQGNIGPNSELNFRPGSEQNFDPNSVVNFESNSGSNFRPNQRPNRGPSTNSWDQPSVGMGGQVQWPGQPADPQQFPRGEPQRPWNPDATWLSSVNSNNIQGPISGNIVQSTTQSSQINPENPVIAVITDPFAPFQFRPGSDDPLPVGTSTLRTVDNNNLDDDEWSWQPATNTRRTTTTTTTLRPRDVTTDHILDDWMLDSLNRASSTTSTTTESTLPRGQTRPVLDDWMLNALNNVTNGVSTSTPTSVPVIPFSLEKCLELYTGTWNCSNSTTPAPKIDIRKGTPPTVRATTQTVISRNQNERPAEAACRTYRELDPAALTFHILDGIPVAPGDYPHMGGLIYPGTGSASQVDLRCGSSLISERYVLTAAHCVNDPLLQPTTVRFGVVVWNVTDDDNQPIDVDIESIIMHPNYVAPARYHDVALIRLVRNVEFSFVVRPACLYSNMGDVDTATKLVVIGWGITNIQTRARSDILLMTNVTTVPITECNATHVNYGLQRTLRNGLNLGQYCAFDPELRKDSCEADSGGPLQIVENKHSTIVGIVSFGMSCGSAVPSVYARVAYYLSWIESVVWPS